MVRRIGDLLHGSSGSIGRGGIMDARSSALVRVLVGAGVGVVAGVAAVDSIRPGHFAPYAGPLHPVLAAAVVYGAGALALAGLERRFDMPVLDRSLSLRDRAVAVACAVPFMIFVTAVDLGVGYPADLNVPLPEALAFYPLIGVVAQQALHVVPFALLLLVLSRIPSLAAEARAWLAIALVPALEAAFQVVGDRSGGGALVPLTVVHLYAFGGVELWLLSRYDYASMYLFRLAYYAWWHVLWGTLRLSL
jgi:hypothetical protein